MPAARACLKQAYQRIQPLFAHQDFRHGSIDVFNALHKGYTGFAGLEVGMEVVQCQRVGVRLHGNRLLNRRGEGLYDFRIGTLLEAEVVEPFRREGESEFSARRQE